MMEIAHAHSMIAETGNANDYSSTQLYVDADARMDTYEVDDGQKRTALNLLQRKSFALRLI